MKATVLFALAAVVALVVSASAVASTKPETRSSQACLDDALGFFPGAWYGKGAFRSGKPLKARVEFRVGAGGHVLIHSHDDISPSTFHSSAVWALVDGRLVMTMFDNFGATRAFSAQDNCTGSFVFERTDAIQATRRERFEFRKIDEDVFEMTYETSANGGAWVLGDRTRFQRTRM